MWEAVGQRLLNGVEVIDFVSFIIAGMIGAIFMFFINVGESVKKDKNTPSKFRWSALKLKVSRFITALISLALVIVFPDKILGFLFESETPIQLTIWSMFIIGMGADQLGKKISSLKRK